MQIKKLKKDKKSLKDKLEHYIQDEVSRSPVVTAPVEDKETNIEPVNTTTQEEDKSTEGKIHSCCNLDDEYLKQRFCT